MGALREFIRRLSGKIAADKRLSVFWVDLHRVSIRVATD